MSSVNPFYELEQLRRALHTASEHADAATRERAVARAKRWQLIIEGRADGSLAIGSRTPTGAPAWVTLEVEHGGFATGAYAAARPLVLDDELLAHCVGAEVRSVLGLNLHFVSDAGRATLVEALARGTYRVELPEEAALLTVAALLERGDVERAGALLDEIVPFFGRLRFFPHFRASPPPDPELLFVTTAGEARRAIASRTTPDGVERLREALGVWAPLTDRAVDLVDAHLRYGTAPEARAGFVDAVTRLQSEYHAARVIHRRCARPHRETETLAVALRALIALRDGAAVTRRDAGLLQRLIPGHLRKQGAAGSELRRRREAERAHVVGAPTHGATAARIAAALRVKPQDLPLSAISPELERLVAPWPSLRRRLLRALAASLEELIERGVLTSGEAIARVLPQTSAHVRARAFTDASLGRLAALTDAAFRRRRSLLLLDYAAQVRLEELPWVRALEPYRATDEDVRAAAHALFQRVTTLSVALHPYAIVPNPLLEELHALARSAGRSFPIVEELAADIFQGGFTEKFVRAAELAADRLEGTLYATYYALPVTRIREIARATPPGHRGPVAAFGALCAEQAPAIAHYVARSGAVIERQQIFTTQNLVQLLDTASADPTVYPDFAWRCFEWLTRRVRRERGDEHAQWRTAKNAAYAWRQMVLYLSLAPKGSVEAFLTRATAHLATLPDEWRARFEPLLSGLRSAREGRRPEQVLLGWTERPHVLVRAEG